MICRLCLIEAVNILNIFTETGEMVKKDILKVVAKHFQIEIRYDDAVSNTICSVCWDHLQEFHKFWLSIEEKQKSLESYFQCTQIKRDIEEVGAEAIAYNDMEISQEKVHTGLCGPEIDIFVGESGQYGREPEFIAIKTEQEDESATYDDSFLPLTESVDVLSKDVESEEIDSNVKQKRKYNKGKEKKVVEKKNSKKGRPRLRESAIKRSQNEVKLKTAESAKNYEEKLKAIRKADEFLAQNTQLSCCICMEKLKDFRGLKTHFRQKHQCTGYAVCCDLRFTKRTLYVDHIQLHKNPDFFKCAICNKQLISRKNYVNHMHSLHPSEENLQFGCKLCPKKFSKQYILDSHIRMRHMPKDHVCKLCDKAFSSIWILAQHEKAVHRNEFESVCEICGKRLRNAANLQYHMDNIHNTEPRPEVECTLCHKWLKSDRSLRKHMISHRDEASGVVFKCPQCDVEKKSRHSLASHIRYHHSNRVFSCTMCAKEFKTPISLKEHEATHTGVDLYTCPFCPKTFRSHANMHKHKIHSHSDEWVRKYAQPNEYTQSVLNQTRKTEA
ncbi:transcription factor grauzone-like [Anastrepha obliqua]|uniref:transcription factor grauzone-like n=1 Tax=Anastrepha obliqua TaxID=95512 RepID=UPI002408F275|nr:transcription factor grauzone-like [Anastrepha obliqua]XP_054727970.1 transcription factor grauzone-like [Anastrepha obliqua]